MSLSNMDFEMAKSFQRGEQKGFEYFFNLLYPQLKYYAWKILEDTDMSEYLVSEAFIKIWEHKDGISHPKVIKSWLYTTVKNDCLNEDKKISYRRRHEIKIAQQTDAIEQSVDEKIIRAEVMGEVYSFFSCLSPECAKILKLLYIEGLSMRQASEKLNLHISTIKTQKYKGIKILQDAFFRGIIHEPRKWSIDVRKKFFGLKNENRSYRSDRDRKIIELRNKNISFKEIGMVVNLSPSRCSRIYHKNLS